MFGAPRLREAKCETVDQMQLVNTLCGRRGRRPGRSRDDHGDLHRPDFGPDLTPAQKEAFAAKVALIADLVREKAGADLVNRLLAATGK